MYICYCPLRDPNWNKNIVLYCIVLLDKECPFNALLSKKLELLTGGEGGSLVELEPSVQAKRNLLWCAMSRFRIFDNLIISMCM